MNEQELIPHLFRTEYRKITAVLCSLFGLAHIEVAEDIASDTFLSASELWPIKGLPESPVAWLYTVAKNKAKNHLKRDTIFTQKIAQQIKYTSAESEEPDIDLSLQNIADSQLQMIFAICHPCLPAEAQICLALRILCGFGIDEIATAFLTNKDTINKRLLRGKDKLRKEQVVIAFPPPAELGIRLSAVLTTLYLLFNEGYYSHNPDTTIRKDLCAEAIRLTSLIIENPSTDLPEVNALFALMSLQASRLNARTNNEGGIVLYHDQDESLWDNRLMQQGEHFLNRAAQGSQAGKYHIEAAIAWWHTQKADTPEKWEQILQLYNQLLIIAYSPIAALNRTYALAKANGNTAAITEAEKLNLSDSHLYHALLGELYSTINSTKAITHFQQAILLARSDADREMLEGKMARLM